MKGLGLRRLGQNVVAVMARQLGSGLLQLVTLALIARVYGPEGNGTYTVALLLPTLFASLFNLGIAPANVYFLGAGKVTPLVAWRATLKLFAIVAPVGLVLGVMAIVLFGEQWFPGVPVYLLAVGILIFPISLFQSLISSFFQGLQKFRLFNLVLLLHPALTLLGITVIVGIGLESIAWLLSAYLGAMVVTVLVAVNSLRPLLTERRVKATSRYELCAINYGYKAHLSNILTFVNYKADIFLVNYFLGPAAAGIYIIAVQITERLWILSQAVSTVLLPRLSELSSDEGKRKLITPLMTRWVLWTTLIVGGLLGVVAYPMIALIFGGDYLGAYIPLLLLLPGVVFVSASRVIANDIAARGRPELNMYTSLIVVTVNVVANIALIPNYGLSGAAIATTIAYTLNFVMRLAMHHRITQVQVVDNLLIRREDWLQLKAVAARRA